MLENNSHLSDDETDSELYHDAIDKEESRNISENDKNELHEFRSSVCVWDDSIIPFHIGVYSQFLEARIVLSNNCPKCDRGCRYPERRNTHIKKLEETVLTCQIANRAEKKICPICCRTTDHCICEKAFIQSKPSSSSHNKKQLCTVCKSTPTQCIKLHDYAKSKTKKDNSDVISLMKDISRIPTWQKHQNKFNSQPVTKSGTKNCRVPVKCVCKSLEKKYTSSPSYMSKLSFFSSEELQLIHSIRGSKLTETLKQNKCILPEKLLGSCPCGCLKSYVAPGKCKFCGKHYSNCVCSKWRDHFSGEDSMNFVAVKQIRDKLQCICGRKKKEGEIQIAGTIEEIKDNKPKTHTISTFPPVKKPETPKSTNKKDIPSKGINKEKKVEEHHKPIVKDKDAKGTNIQDRKIEPQRDKLSSEIVSEKISNPPTSSPPIPKTVERADEQKKYNEIKKPEPNKTHRESEKSDIHKDTGRKIEDKKQPDASKGDGEEMKISKQPEDKKPENSDKPLISLKTEEKKVENIKPPESSKTINIKKSEDIRESKKIGDKKTGDVEKPVIIKQSEKRISDVKKSETPKSPDRKNWDNKETVDQKVQEGFKKPEEQKEYKELRKDASNREPQHEKTIEADNLEPQKITDNELSSEKSDEKLFLANDNEITDGDEQIDHKFVEPDITITIEISDKDENFKYSVEGKEDHQKEDNVLEGQVVFPEAMRKGKICQCHADELPIMVSQKCKPCETKCKKCSRIPRSTSRIISKGDMSKELADRKICHCCNDSTNTEKKEVTEKGEQWESSTRGRVLLCKKCKQSINKAKEANTEVMAKENPSISNRNSIPIKLSKCRAMGGVKRSSTFVSSTKEYDKLDTSIRNTNGCSKICRRPSTASKIDERKTREFDSGNTTPRESSKNRMLTSCDETLVRICQPCSELLPLSSEKTCPRKESPNKKFVAGKICHCHVNINTDRENLVDKEQQCVKRPSRAIKSKECSHSQTGGTFEQDVIASYVASCTSNSETPPPQQFIIQTLLYQFAGYELNKDPTPPRRRRPPDRSRTPQPQEPCENVMRSIQVQVGPTCPPKCETAQTVTTFILTDPRTLPKFDTMPAVEGKINYVCGPEVPGIRTKVAMNLKQIPSIDEEQSCICTSERDIEQLESFDQCESSMCSYYQNKNTDLNEKSQPNYKVTKKDKYVFITVTPVQTEPYEPNYYIIFQTTEDESNDKKENKSKKAPKSCTKSKQEKVTAQKYPLDHFKNQIFSLETLKSKEFLELYEKKQEAIQDAKVIGSSCGTIDPACIAALLEKNKIQGSELTNAEIRQKNVENKGCGPDTCEYFKEPQKNEAVECCFVNEEVKVTTRTLACGSDHCIHQTELNESRNAEVSTSSNRSREKRGEDVLCGPDICSFKELKDSGNGERICISIQTEEIFQKRNAIKSSEAIIVKVACDACTTTASQERGTVPSHSEYCDKKVCTNACEIGELASQACDVIEVKAHRDNDCNTVVGVQGESRTVTEIDLNECDDDVCPEKVTKSADKLRDDYDKAETSLQNEECEDSVCVKKRVNTKLDDKDVFALELAMSRFIRVNPKSINED